jgi:hypothetical protein
MILFVSTNTGQAPTAGLAGWTKVGEKGLSDLRTQMWTRLAASGDAGKALTVSFGSITKTDLTLLGYSGATAVRPVATWAGMTESTSTNAHQTPSVTISDANAVIVSYWIDKTSSNTGWTLPSGQIRRSSQVGTGSGRLVSVASDSGKVAATGTAPNVSATAAVASAKATMWSVALTSAPIG